MITSLPHTSATIYQFPLGGRAGLNAAKTGNQEQLNAAASKDVALTDAWYHQDAIREAQQATKQ